MKILVQIPKVHFSTKRGEVVVDSVYASDGVYDAFSGYVANSPDRRKSWRWAGLVRDDLNLNLTDDESDRGKRNLRSLQEISKHLCIVYDTEFSPT